jgi:valyl-tRNA synthetase
MGHALNNTLQDILCRFERMRGRDVLWQPAPTTPASPRRWWSSGS